MHGVDHLIYTPHVCAKRLSDQFCLSVCHAKKDFVVVGTPSNCIVKLEISCIMGNTQYPQFL